MSNEMPPMPKTLEEAHRVIASALAELERPRIYIDTQRFQEGYWHYRDRENGSLFIVTMKMKPGTSIVYVARFSLFYIGVLGEIDKTERNHSQGQEIITSIDNIGDFESVAEVMQRRNSDQR